MRGLVTTRYLVIGLGKHMIYDLKDLSQVLKAWTENIGTHNLANSEGLLITPMTKQTGIKYRWLISYIKYNTIRINRIVTKE